MIMSSQEFSSSRRNAASHATNEKNAKNIPSEPAIDIGMNRNAHIVDSKQRSHEANRHGADL
jgi:hypothetical protein